MNELERNVEALKRAVQKLTARVDALEQMAYGTRPNAMPLGDLLAERFRHPGEAVSANQPQTPIRGTDEAD